MARMPAPYRAAEALRRPGPRPAPASARGCRRPWLAVGPALAGLAAGCASLPVRRQPGPPFAGLPLAEPAHFSGDWFWLGLAMAAGLLAGALLARLWRARRLRQALARPQGLVLPAEVGSLRAALALIEDLVLTWQERDRSWGGRQNHAPAGGDPAGAVVGGENERGTKPGGWPPAR